MSINFNFGEHFYSGASSHLTYDLIISIAGAFFGFLFAIWISRWNIRKNNKKEKQLQKDNNITKYHFLRERLSSVVSYCTKQADCYDTHSKELLETPYEIVEFKYFADCSLQRINKLDVLDMWESFNEIHKCNENKLIVFRRLFNHIDFLQTKFDSTEERLNDLSNSITKIQLDFSGLLEHITLLISIRLKKIDNSKSQIEEHIYLSTILNEYKKIIKEHSDLFLKTEQKIINPINEKILIKTSDAEFGEKIHMYTMKAKFNLQHIKYNKEYESSLLKDFKSSIITAIQSLEKISQQMQNVP
jgi:hypothetical protein